MNLKFPIASTAALIADPARAAMVTALLDGQALPAGELARIANISAQSASMHLAQLLTGGFLNVSRQGRHRYYRISCPEVAHAVEALSIISTPAKPKQRVADDAMCYARTCYDHLAGQVAVRLADAFERDQLLVAANERDYLVTHRGEEFFASWNIEIANVRALRRHFARRCLDWTERRSHIAGALGSAIYQRLLERRWIACSRNDRAVRLTSNGARHLGAFLHG